VSDYSLIIRSPHEECLELVRTKREPKYQAHEEPNPRIRKANLWPRDRNGAPYFSIGKPFRSGQPTWTDAPNSILHRLPHASVAAFHWLLAAAPAESRPLLPLQPALLLMHGNCHH
jgi:hypothetical protein